jgi:hypothetical protein
MRVAMRKALTLEDSMKQVSASKVGTTWTVTVEPDGLTFASNRGETFKIKHSPASYTTISEAWLMEALDTYGSPTKIARAHHWEPRDFARHIAKTFNYHQTHRYKNVRKDVLAGYEKALKLNLPFDADEVARHYRVNLSTIYKWINDFENGKVAPAKRGVKLGTTRSSSTNGERSRRHSSERRARPKSLRTKK